MSVRFYSGPEYNIFKTFELIFYLFKEQNKKLSKGRGRAHVGVGISIAPVTILKTQKKRVLSK